MSTGSRDGYGMSAETEKYRNSASSRGQSSVGSSGNMSGLRNLRSSADLFERFAVNDEEQSHVRRSLDDDLVIIPVETSTHHDTSQMSISSNSFQVTPS